MPAAFRNHLEKFVETNDEEYAEISTYFTQASVRKKENLLEEGQICRLHFFVLSGCLRKLFINEKGVEQTTEFAIENWWITDNIAYERQQATGFYTATATTAGCIFGDRIVQ